MSPNFTDWVAICETKARYCRCLDTKDWAGYADVFTEDLVLDTTPAGGFKAEGRDEAIRLIRQSVDHAKTAHQVQNPEITFDADGANVIWAMQDRVQWSPDKGKELGLAGHTGYGHYRERYVRCADGTWRIKAQVLSYLHFDAMPLPP